MQKLVEYRVEDGNYTAQHYVYLKTKIRNYYVNNGNRFLMLWENGRESVGRGEPIRRGRERRGKTNGKMRRKKNAQNAGKRYGSAKNHA